MAAAVAAATCVTRVALPHVLILATTRAVVADEVADVICSVVCGTVVVAAATPVAAHPATWVVLLRHRAVVATWVVATTFVADDVAEDCAACLAAVSFHVCATAVVAAVDAMPVVAWSLILAAAP